MLDFYLTRFLFFHRVFYEFFFSFDLSNSFAVLFFVVCFIRLMIDCVAMNRVSVRVCVWRQRWRHCDSYAYHFKHWPRGIICRKQRECDCLIYYFVLIYFICASASRDFICSSLLPTTPSQPSMDDDDDNDDFCVRLVARDDQWWWDKAIVCDRKCFFYFSCVSHRNDGNERKKNKLNENHSIQWRRASLKHYELTLFWIRTLNSCRKKIVFVFILFTSCTSAQTKWTTAHQARSRNRGKQNK